MSGYQKLNTNLNKPYDHSKSFENSALLFFPKLYTHYLTAPRYQFQPIKVFLSLNNPNVFFPKRLLLTLIAGEYAGGDKRGMMSAAIKYFKPNKRIMTLRIDYSNDPLKDLSMALEQRYSIECKDAFDR